MDDPNFTWWHLNVADHPTLVISEQPHAIQLSQQVCWSKSNQPSTLPGHKMNYYLFFVTSYPTPVRTASPLTLLRLPQCFPMQDWLSLFSMMLWFFSNFITHGMRTPATNKLPKHMRKCSIQSKNTAISSYMQHHWAWNGTTNQGNPTQDKSALAMIAHLGQF